MLLEASSALCTAVEGRAYFRNVTILIPNDWATNCLVDDTNITWPRTHMADLIVTPNHPNFGSQPFTLNYGGCGVSSLPVRLPIGYLTALGKGSILVLKFDLNFNTYRCIANERCCNRPRVVPLSLRSFRRNRSERGPFIPGWISNNTAGSRDFADQLYEWAAKRRMDREVCFCII
jgi:hypothetical protein